MATIVITTDDGTKVRTFVNAEKLDFSAPNVSNEFLNDLIEAIGDAKKIDSKGIIRCVKFGGKYGAEPGWGDIASP